VDDSGKFSKSVSRINPDRTAASLSADAECYRDLALRVGATDARVIEVGSIPVDDRVLMKCRVPRCSGYGTCGNCPPHCPSPGETRGFLDHYHTAVAYRLSVDPAVIVAGADNKEQLKAARRSLYDMTAVIESAAFYDGHYFATGLACGNCKTVYCSDQDCAVLMGEKCRQSLKARPAMEALGIDCFALAVRLGWEIYPIGKSARAEDIPASFLMGMVVIE
jgi:predicted metal-binding protein